jgi:tRNA (Thr-GGU) A37 N-methylase
MKPKADTYYSFTPIGRVRSPFKRPEDIPPPAFAPPGFFDRARGELRVFKRYEPALKDTEGFSHPRRHLRLHRAGGFNCRLSPGDRAPRHLRDPVPHRPNPIGLTVSASSGDAARSSG